MQAFLDSFIAKVQPQSSRALALHHGGVVALPDSAMAWRLLG